MRLVRVVLTAVLALGLAGVTLAPAQALSADVNDFTFSRYDADLYVGVDSDGRAVLRTVATYVAQFPDIDQNRGIQLLIPERYEGRPTDLTIDSVADGSGQPRDFEVDTDDGLRIVTIADDDFVYGEQTYVVRTTQQNVILERDDGTGQEFYWDLNGTDWAQSFDRVTARIRVADEIAGGLDGTSACYRGGFGAEDTCRIDSNSEPDGVVFGVDERDLEARQTVTVAIGFDEGTFVQRDGSFWASAFALPLIGGLLALLAGIVLAIRARRGPLRDAEGRPTVIAEYAPPTGLTAFDAAVFRARPATAVAAQVLEFAVAGIGRIIERPGADGAFGSKGKPEYALEVVSATAGTPEQRRLFRSMFGAEPEVGAEYAISTSKKLGKRAAKLLSKKSNTPAGRGWRDSKASRVGILPLVLGVFGAIAAILFAILMLVDARGGAVAIPALVVSALGMVATIVAVARLPLTPAGAELRDHLAGLELYIRMAEADRLRVLQSPEGAERRASPSVNAAGGRDEILHLNERLLPYAVVFGQERDWAKVLGEFYEDTQPNWYAGTSSSTFNAAVFASSIGAMSSSVTSSFSSTISSSSSSGGSSGGGSAGGGGGGGGGGGV